MQRTFSPPHTVQELAVRTGRGSRLLTTSIELISLTKPGLSALVLATEAAGMALAPGRCDLLRAVATLVGTGCLIGSANVFNWLERRRDALMPRTRGRALPARRVHPDAATGLGRVLGLVSLVLLAFASDGLTLLLGALAFVVYVGAYTPLKARTWWALPLGAVSGAFPPLMGWTAVEGSIGSGGAALFALLLAWQIPYFLAIALVRMREYEAAGFRISPAVYNEEATRIGIAVSVALLLCVSLTLPLFGLGGLVYAQTAVALGAFIFLLALMGALLGAGRAWAQLMFRFSLVHLVVLFAALLLFKSSAPALAETSEAARGRVDRRALPVTRRSEPHPPATRLASQPELTDSPGLR